MIPTSIFKGYLRQVKLKYFFNHIISSRPHNKIKEYYLKFKDEETGSEKCNSSPNFLSHEVVVPGFGPSFSDHSVLSALILLHLE